MTAPATTKPRKPRYPATVKRVERLTLRMVRVTFTGPELADFGWNGPAAHIKLIFAGAGADSVTAALSAVTPASDATRPTMRTYTPRRFDREAHELDVDFILHGEGPASTWAAQAAAMRRIRTHLLTDKTINRAHVTTRGYWKLGAVDHPDGDYGQET